MKNWKTTVCGVLAAVGQAMQASELPTFKAIGQILTAAAFLLLGASAKDNNVTGV